MHVALHDCGGYPFTFQLARALARRGCVVDYLWFSPPHSSRANPDSADFDDDKLRVIPLEMGRDCEKSNYLKRYLWEREYGRLASKRIANIKPDTVLSANTPLLAQKCIAKACDTANANFIYWLQDIRAVAARTILGHKLPFIGHAAGWWLMRLQRRLLHRSDRVIAISESFRPTLRKWGLPDAAMHVIPNWTPLEETPQRPRKNEWARAQGLDDKKCLLYSGNLGSKHHPQIFVELCERFRGRDDVIVVIVSEGSGARMLQKEKKFRKLHNLRILGFQPYERLPDVLGTADILMGMLSRAASEFSVPSKVLTYLCAGRPVLLSMPQDNPAARIVEKEGAGRVVPPDDAAGFYAVARELLADPDLRRHMGKKARRYAERAFNIERIAARFEEVICHADAP